MAEPLFGLVLAGGQSQRMQRDKALLDYHGQPQLEWTYELLRGFCDETFISVRREQHDELRDRLPRIEDDGESIGPAAGMLAAYRHAQRGWLVLACDLPYLGEAVLQRLIRARDESQQATAFRSAHDGLPEPLCAIWEPSGLDWLTEQVAAGVYCPRKALIRGRVKLLQPFDATALDNINTPHEHAAALHSIGSG